MRVRDEQLWSQQVSDLHADGEAGKRFLEFFELWFGAADRLFDEWVGGPANAMTVVRLGLDLAENELGYLSVDWIGQMLVVASMHWAHGAEMTDQMTSLEQRLMHEALARKIANLQVSAKTD
jgi:hypothetical protein